MFDKVVKGTLVSSNSCFAIGKEVELLILVPKDDKLNKTKKVSTKPFIARWAGCLKDADFDPDNAKYEYLSEKHQC